MTPEHYEEVRAVCQMLLPFWMAVAVGMVFRGYGHKILVVVRGLSRFR